MAVTPENVVSFFNEATAPYQQMLNQSLANPLGTADMTSAVQSVLRMLDPLFAQQQRSLSDTFRSAGQGTRAGGAFPREIAGLQQNQTKQATDAITPLLLNLLSQQRSGINQGAGLATAGLQKVPLAQAQPGFMESMLRALGMSTAQSLPLIGGAALLKNPDWLSGLFGGGASSSSNALANLSRFPGNGDPLSTISQFNPATGEVGNIFSSIGSGISSAASGVTNFISNLFGGS